MPTPLLSFNTLTEQFPLGKRVLVRVDFNVPINKDGAISDTARILQHKETLDFLTEHDSEIVLVAHWGSPDGKPDPAFSFHNIIGEISTLLARDIQVHQFKNCTTSKDYIVLLENIRFNPGEENNSTDLCTELADVADIYINDAFSVSHREHASVVGITHLLPSYAGFALIREVESLSSLFHQPKQPVTLIIGGKKVSDKIGVLQHLLPSVQHVLIGGACANTFAVALGQDVQKSFVEENMVTVCKELLESPHGHKIVLPADYIEEDYARVDIGPRTIQIFHDILLKSSTVIWAGPLGKYENPCWNDGNLQTLRSVVASGAVSVVGGGDTVAALCNFSEFQQLNFVSLGGGAMLQFLEKETLVGLQALARPFPGINS